MNFDDKPLTHDQTIGAIIFGCLSLVCIFCFNCFRICYKPLSVNLESVKTSKKTPLLN